MIRNTHSMTMGWLLLGLLGPGCDGGGRSGDPPRVHPNTRQQTLGRLDVHLVDRPDEVDALLVSLDRLSFQRCRPEEGEWLHFDFEPRPLDLLQLTEGAFAELLHSVELEAGHYCEVRLRILPDAQVMLTSGEVQPLKIPSATSSGFKVKGGFDIVPGGSTTVVIDFDVSRSLKQVAHERRYQLKPVVEIVRARVVDGEGQPLPDGELVDTGVFTVEPEGSTISLGGNSQIVFPPQAVEQPSRFSFTRWSLDSPGLLTDIYVLEPGFEFGSVPTVMLEADAARLAPEGDLFILLDQERVAAELHGDLLIGSVEHFSRISGQQVVRAEGEFVLGTSGADSYVAPGTHQCGGRSAAVEGCEGDVRCFDLDVECDGWQTPELSCATFEFEHQPGSGKALVRVEFSLTAEEVRRLQHGDGTVEWQLKFFKEGGRSVVTRFTTASTDIPGAVSDSTCNAPGEGEDDPEQSGSPEMTAAVVTLCPGSLVAGAPYEITYRFEVDEGEMALPADPMEVRRAFQFDIIPGRLCERCNGLFGSVRANCEEYVNAPEGDSADANFSWNCRDNRLKVIGIGDPVVGGRDFNVVPFDRLTVKRAGGVVTDRIRGVDGSCAAAVAPPAPDPQPAGAIVLEEDDPAVHRMGTPEYWHDAAFGSAGAMIWTFNNDGDHGVDNRMIYRFEDLAPGRYRVDVHIPNNYATTRRACYYVTVGGGSWGLRVDQSAYFNEWVTLGTFEAGNLLLVDLEDLTHEPWATRWVGYDAVRIVPAPGAPLDFLAPACLE